MVSKFITISIVLSVGFISILGFSGFMSVEHSLVLGCPVTSMSGSDCSNIHNALAMTMHHIDGLQYLTQAIVSDNSQILSILFVLAVVFSVFVFSVFQKEILVSKNLYFYRQRNVDNLTYFSRNILRWIVFQNKADSRVLAKQGVL